MQCILNKQKIAPLCNNHNYWYFDLRQLCRLSTITFALSLMSHLNTKEEYCTNVSIFCTRRLAGWRSVFVTQAFLLVNFQITGNLSVTQRNNNICLHFIGGLVLQFGRKNIHLKILWPFCGFPIHKFTIIFRVCT